MTHLTDEQLARAIAEGLVTTGIEGGFENVCCSTAGDYPSMGVSQWEGIGGRGDLLLSYIDNGSQYAGRTYSDLESTVDDDGISDKSKLSELLDSEQGHEAQLILLSSDCLYSYLPMLRVAGLTDDSCLIYCGLWCPTSDYVVMMFLQRRASRGYDINDLETVNLLFHEEYADAADCSEYAEGYANRADNIYAYVKSLPL